jgi:hypothetical protein
LSDELWLGKRLFRLQLFVAQCTRWAAFDLFNDSINSRTVHIDPRFIRDVEDRRQATHALPCVDANLRVIADDDFVVLISCMHSSACAASVAVSIHFEML